MRYIDYSYIAKSVLMVSRSYLRKWLPRGRVVGREYISLNPTRLDCTQGSFKVNIETGRWADFSTGDSGGDLISLYAYLNNITQKAAAVEIADRLGIYTQNKYFHMR